jgi:WD40 repeat protein
VARWAPDLIAVSGDGKLLATRFEPKLVNVNEIATGKLVVSLTLESDHDAAALALATDGKRLAIASVHGPIRVWDTTTRKMVSELGKAVKKELWPFPIGPGERPELRYTPDGNTLALLSRTKYRRLAPSITLLDPQAGKELRVLKGSNEWKQHTDVTSFVFSPDSKLFAIATMERDYGLSTLDGKGTEVIGKPEVCVGRISTGEIIHKWKITSPTSLAFSADSAKLYAKATDTPEFQEFSSSRFRNFY